MRGTGSTCAGSYKKVLWQYHDSATITKMAIPTIWLPFSNPWHMKIFHEYEPKKILRALRIPSWKCQNEKGSCTDPCCTSAPFQDWESASAFTLSLLPFYLGLFCYVRCTKQCTGLWMQKSRLYKTQSRPNGKASFCSPLLWQFLMFIRISASSKNRSLYFLFRELWWVIAR